MSDQTLDTSSTFSSVDSVVDSAFDTDLPETGIEGGAAVSDDPSDFDSNVDAAMDAGDEAPEQNTLAEDPAEQEAAAEEAPKPVGKLLKAKLGESEIDFDDGTLLPVKVDGKLTHVPVSELAANYSGKVAWDKRFTELDKKNKAFEGQQGRQQTLIRDLSSNVKSGNTYEAVDNLIEMAGMRDQVDPQQYLSDLRNLLLSEAQQLASLSPDQRRIFELEEARKADASRMQRLNKRQQDEAAGRETEAKFQTLLQQSGLSYDDFQQHRREYEEGLKRQGVDSGAITTDTIVGYARNKQVYSVAKEAVELVDAQLLDQPLSNGKSYWDYAASLVKQHPDFTKEDIADIMRTAVGSKAKTAVNKKLQKAPVATLAKAKSSTTARAAKTDFSRVSAEDADW